MNERLLQWELEDEVVYMGDVISAFDKYKPHLLSEVAKAAAITDVKTWANNDFKGDLSECTTAMIDHIETYCESNKKSAQFLAKATEGMNKYLNKEGHFSLASTINKGKTFSPHTFFDLFCSSIPEFAEIAMRLASKPSASGAAERDHKDTKFVWTKARNRLTPGKVEMLKYRYSSIRMKNRAEFDEGAQADNEFDKYWDPEDFVDPGIQTVAPPSRTMVNDIQENAFHAYIEKWEEALLTISEATDSTARFGLATKYMGVVMCDKQLNEWHVVVDLEWSRKKIKGFPYGNNKGWVLVGELMPGHHDEEIADVGVSEKIREPFIINEATSVEIIAAASAQPRPMIMKTAAVESSGEE